MNKLQPWFQDGHWQFPPSPWHHHGTAVTWCCLPRVGGAPGLGSAWATYHSWLVVEPPLLTNISQLGWSFPLYGKIYNVVKCSKPPNRHVQSFSDIQPILKWKWNLSDGVSDNTSKQLSRSLFCWDYCICNETDIFHDRFLKSRGAPLSKASNYPTPIPWHHCCGALLAGLGDKSIYPFPTSPFCIQSNHT